MKKIPHQEIVTRQQEKITQKRLPFCVILNNIRSLYNVGSIFRTADGAGVEKLWLCGITGHPPNTMITKTALGAENILSWEYHESAIEIIKMLKTMGYDIVMLEQIKESIPYQHFIPKKPICLVIGNEITGVSDELLSLCDHAIEIEMHGLKNSLNVSVAFGIAAYRISTQLRINQYL